jgi:hypothetical protein
MRECQYNERDGQRPGETEPATSKIILFHFASSFSRAISAVLYPSYHFQQVAPGFAHFSPVSLMNPSHLKHLHQSDAALRAILSRSSVVIFFSDLSVPNR